MTMQILTSSEDLITVASGVEISSVKVFFIVMPSDEVTSTDDPLVVTLTYADAYDGSVEEEVSLPYIKTIDNNHYYSAPWKNIVKISTGDDPPVVEDALWDDTEEWDDEDTWSDETLSCISSTAPKIFQGTESNFVVIESPFVPAPQGGHSSWKYDGKSWSSLNYPAGLTSNFRGNGDATSYWQRKREQYGKLPYRAIYSTIYSSVTFNSTVFHNSYAPYTPGNYPNSSQLYHIIQLISRGTSANSYIGNGQWIAEPHTDPTKGFLFWSAYNGNNEKIQATINSIQKSMVFIEGQTVIDTSDFWFPATTEVPENVNGFKASIVPWTEGLDDRLKRRWLLSSDGKILKYYATDFSADWNVLGTGDFELSTPTTLEASTPTIICD